MDSLDDILYRKNSNEVLEKSAGVVVGLEVEGRMLATGKCETSPGPNIVIYIG